MAGKPVQGGGAAAGQATLLARRLDQAGGAEIAGERRRVIRGCRDRLVHAAGFGETERAREDPDRHVRPPQLAADAVERRGEDRLVIECKRRMLDRADPAGEWIGRPRLWGHERQVGHRRNPPPRIALRPSERRELLEIDAIKAGLFAQLARRRLGGILVRADESARETG